MKAKKLIPLILAVCLVFLTAACNRAAAVPALPPAATLQPGDSERKLTVNNLERTYLIHLPPGLTGQQAVPLVFVFHGLSENAGYISMMSGFNAVADSNGFIVVYPNGSGPSGALSWNAGGCCGYALENDVDDGAFVRQIIADAGSIAKIDAKRIYASGFSNGGLLSYRLACDLSDVFAAVAPVAGVLLFSPCQPGQLVSVIAVHGLSDNLVPYEGGGIVPGSGQPFPSVEESLAVFARLDGCGTSPKVEKDGILTHSVYEACQGGMAVELYTVSGVGHMWPPAGLMPATELIWDFFAAHPKP